MNSPQRTPDWLLERIALGELPPEELAAARARLAQEPDGLARLAALETDSRATLERLPPGQVVREVEARASGAAARASGAASRKLAPAWGLLVPALATVALFVLARPDGRVGVILSVDGRGSVTLHAPDVGAQAVALAPSGTHMLPRAYELDDAPRFERFFFITGDAPFLVAPVLEAARTLAEGPEARSGELSLPKGLTQVSFTLEKQRR